MRKPRKESYRTLQVGVVLWVTAGVSALFAGPAPVTVKVTSGQSLEVQALAPGIFRVRLGPSAVFAPSLQERYGVVRTDWSGVPVETRSTTDTVTLRTAYGDLRMDKASGNIALRDHEGRVLSPEISPLLSNPTVEQRRQLWIRAKTLVELFRNTNKKYPPSPDYPNPDLGDSPERARGGFGLTVRLQPGERFYGLGTGSKKHIQLRGQAFYNWVSYKYDEQPVPFIMSSAGWGLFLNTSWRHYVDVGKGKADQMLIWGPEGDLDFFLITGSGLPQLLDRYTQITGRPMLLPLWAYGLTWINHVLSNQFEVLENARIFRQEHIPCDGFGLDAGWAKGKEGYNCSTPLEWNTDRFYMPDFMRGKGGANQSFIAALRRMGFKLHLWSCTDYDLTGEEERVVAEREHRLTPPGPEARFAHLKSLLDDGVEAWKFDEANLDLLPDPKRQYVNGRTESEMHNLNQVLLVKQISEGQKQYTGRRVMMQYSGGWAGTQQWAASITGDIMAGPDGLVWLLNSGMSGFMNTSGDMWVNRPASQKWCDCAEEGAWWPDGAGIHFGFLMPWTLIDGWAYSEQPWLAGEELERMVKDYARLRYRLMPYIYSAAHTGSLTGMPIMRAMPLMYPDDPAFQDSIREYMLGDYLLVTVFTPKVRFPAGRWIDYWTGKEYRGPSEIVYTIPGDRGGGLFIRAGAILPYWPEMDYVGQKPVDALSLHVYPNGRSHFTLYEDDGLTFEYEKGEFAQTDITCRQEKNEVVLSIAPRQGSYAGMPQKRRFAVWIQGAKPIGVSMNRQSLEEGPVGWQYDSEAKAVRLEVEEDPGRTASQVVHVLW